MIVQIRGAGFRNLGAELMLRSVIAQLNKQPRRMDVCLAPREAPYVERISVPHFQKLDLGKYGGVLSTLLTRGRLARRMMANYGIVKSSDISVILDASGFAIGDRWPLTRIQKTAKEFEEARRNGTLIILLPQAFGPFNDAAIARYAKRALAACDLIFVRDQYSMEFVKALVGQHEGLRYCPDFTNMTTELPEASIVVPGNKPAALVPNRKITDHAILPKDKYVDFFKRATGHLQDCGYTPFILNHERKMDRPLCRDIASAAGDLEIVEAEDALDAKSIMRQCSITIGSRFHGLVNALGQGVPAIGTSWSHKYSALFSDYEHGDWLMRDLNDDQELKDKIFDIAAHDQDYSAGIRQSGQELRKRSAEMWREVFDAIDARFPS